MTHEIPGAKNVQACIAGCRSYQDLDEKRYGYPFASLGKGPKRTRGRGPHCFCGDEPDGEDEPHQFGDLLASPVECIANCPGNEWQRCGGHRGRAVSVWSVPKNAEKADLGGICVNSYELAGHKFPFDGPSEKSDKMRPEYCREFCRDQGFGQKIISSSRL